MQYLELKNHTFKTYKHTKPVYCPYLKTKIVFNSKGFWHMVYTGRNKKRSRKSQKLRFRLFPLAVKVISLTSTLQEIEVRGRQRLTYYGFIAILDEWKLKVIVKKRGSGQPFFWSVIPNWITRRKADRNIKSLFKGNMETD